MRRLALIAASYCEKKTGGGEEVRNGRLNPRLVKLSRVFP